MPILTTEAQRHRENANEKDPRTAPIIGGAIEVHRVLGPGLLESAYEECLCHELHLRGLSFERQVDLPVSYKGLLLGCGYKIDLIVQEQVILELKESRSFCRSTRPSCSPISSFQESTWAS